MPNTKPIIMSCESQNTMKFNVKTAHAPGITCHRCETEHYVYRAAFFGATKEYEEHEGWQPASSQRRRKRQSRGWEGNYPNQDE